MISRLSFISVSRVTMRIQTSRLLRRSSLASTSRDEPVPVYVPKPAVGERNWLGSLKAPGEQYPHKPHKLRKEDVLTFFGAGLGVILTFLLVTFYTDLFGKNIAKKNRSQIVHENASHKSIISKTTHKVDHHKELESHPFHDEGRFSIVEKPTPDGNQKIISSRSEEVPKFVEYLLVGAGTAAYYASLAIRARHADAKVLMVGEENHLPYNRPPLSKELWWYGDEQSSSTLQYKGLNGKKRDVYFESEGFFVPPSELSSTKHGGVSLVKGRRVSKLCPDEKKAYLDDGTCIAYSKCLIATGGKPKVLPQLENIPQNVKEKILYLRGVDDYRKLEDICKSSKSLSIVGGGFLGSELAYSIKRKYNNLKITQVVAENGNLNGVLPEFLSRKASEALRGIGVDVITDSEITAARERDGNVDVEVNGSEHVTSDYVVVAVGIQPDISVAEASGLEIDSRFGGISTDAELRVRSDIWAAGDAASFYDKTLGRRRIEHWDNAQVSGRLAGENMTGAGKAFWYQPAFFSKIAPEWHINAVGVTDSSLPTVSVFAKDDNGNGSYDRGVVFYKGDEGKVVGVLLLNVFGSAVDVARRLIDERPTVEDFRQLAKLFPLYKPVEADAEQH